jgi:hypothetical protein
MSAQISYEINLPHTFRYISKYSLENEEDLLAFTSSETNESTIIYPQLIRRTYPGTKGYIESPCLFCVQITSA